MPSRIVESLLSWSKYFLSLIKYVHKMLPLFIQFKICSLGSLQQTYCHVLVLEQPVLERSTYDFHEQDERAIAHVSILLFDFETIF